MPGLKEHSDKQVSEPGTSPSALRRPASWMRSVLSCESPTVPASPSIPALRRSCHGHKRYQFNSWLRTADVRWMPI